MKKTELDRRLLNEVKERREQIQSGLIGWGREHYRVFPWRENRSPYAVLVSEVLLKRTTASAVNRVYEEFMACYPDPSALRNADCRRLEGFLSKIGYHKRRTKILLEIAEYIMTSCKGRIPMSRDELMEIPHVGSYTANAVLSFGYGVPSAIVDSNVERIVKRLFCNHLTAGEKARRVQEVADLLSPEEDNQTYNYALLDFGALVCRYGLPKCTVCPVSGYCEYFLSSNPSI